MSTLGHSQFTVSPSVVLTITPFRIKNPESLIDSSPITQIIEEIVSDHSVPGTVWQNGFYQDLKDRSRLYHLQTSPPEPHIGWFNHPFFQNPTTASSTISSTNTKTLAQKPSLEDRLRALYEHAIPETSNGIIRLGLATRYSNPPFTAVPFTAPVLLIGTRNAPADFNSTSQAQLEAELEKQLARLHRDYTQPYGVAVGWRKNGYSAHQAAGEPSPQQFLTVSGWDSVQKYCTYLKNNSSIASRQSALREGFQPLSSELVGTDLVWGKKIA